MRFDLRKNDEMRPVLAQSEFLHNAAGSVLISFGNTRVICSASIVEDLPQWMKIQKKSGGWLTSEYQLLPSSTPERSKREVQGISGRTHEIQRLIGRSLRASVDLEKLGRRTIYVDCDVIDADGGTRCASITGAMIAVRIALSKLLEKKMLPESPLSRNIAAVSVGIVNGTPLLDLCYQEDVSAETDMNVVMAEDGSFVEIQSTAEKNTFTRKQFDEMLLLSEKGIKQLFKIQNEVILKGCFPCEKQ
jgi:ribonuclease PH